MGDTILRAAGDAPPSRRARPAPYLVTMMLAAVVCWLGLMLLPSDPYRRFSTLDGTDYGKLRWIYERLVFDPTPVDIAFLGSSRTMLGVSAPAVEADMTGGRPTGRVANLAIPSLGRDTAALLADLLVERKQPRTVFVELDAIEARPGNPSFASVATPAEVLSALLALDDTLPKLLFRIPARQARQAVLQWLWPQRFDPAGYEGPLWDDSLRTHRGSGDRSPPRVNSMERQAFDRLDSWWLGNVGHKIAQYDAWAWIEFHYNESFLRRTLDRLRGAGTRIVFLYQTAVGAPVTPVHEAWLRAYGEIWPMPEAVLRDISLWDNPTHLNARGAAAYSAWLAGRLRAAGLDQNWK